VSHFGLEFGDNKNVIGFSDYTIVGKEFVESGGPAYVVAIHLSYINDENFDEMYVRHFSSYDDNSPADPGGKFIAALQKLVAEANLKTSIFYPTKAISEFIEINDRKHYPGLGQVKKLSIKHHIETITTYIERQKNA